MTDGYDGSGRPDIPWHLPDILSEVFRALFYNMPGDEMGDAVARIKANN